MFPFVSHQNSILCYEWRKWSILNELQVLFCPKSVEKYSQLFGWSFFHVGFRQKIKNKLWTATSEEDIRIFSFAARKYFLMVRGKDEILTSKTCKSQGIGCSRYSGHLDFSLRTNNLQFGTRGYQHFNIGCINQASSVRKPKSRNILPQRHNFVNPTLLLLRKQYEIRDLHAFFAFCSAILDPPSRISGFDPVFVISDFENLKLPSLEKIFPTRSWKTHLLI